MTYLVEVDCDIPGIANFWLHVSFAGFHGEQFASQIHGVYEVRQTARSYHAVLLSLCDLFTVQITNFSLIVSIPMNFYQFLLLNFVPRTFSGDL